MTFNPRTGDTARFFFVEEKIPFKSHFFLPLDDDRVMRISTPVEGCKLLTDDDACVFWISSNGLAEVIQFPEGRVIRRLAIPARASLYPMEGGFVFCLEQRQQCFWVDDSLEPRPLGLYGSNVDGCEGSPCQSLYLHNSRGGWFGVFPGGTWRRIPERCQTRWDDVLGIRHYRESVLCRTPPGEAELRDLRTWDLLGKARGVQELDYVYDGIALKRVLNRLQVIQGGKVVESHLLDCAGLSPGDLLFDRDTVYVIYRNHETLCMDMYRIHTRSHP